LIVKAHRSEASIVQLAILETNAISHSAKVLLDFIRQPITLIIDPMISWW